MNNMLEAVIELVICNIAVHIKLGCSSSNRSLN